MQGILDNICRQRQREAPHDSNKYFLSLLAPLILPHTYFLLVTPSDMISFVLLKSGGGVFWEDCERKTDGEERVKLLGGVTAEIRP